MKRLSVLFCLMTLGFRFSTVTAEPITMTPEQQQQVKGIIAAGAVIGSKKAPETPSATGNPMNAKEAMSMAFESAEKSSVQLLASGTSFTGRWRLDAYGMTNSGGYQGDGITFGDGPGAVARIALDFKGGEMNPFTSLPNAYKVKPIEFVNGTNGKPGFWRTATNFHHEMFISIDEFERDVVDTDIKGGTVYWITGSQLALRVLCRLQSQQRMVCRQDYQFAGRIDPRYLGFTRIPDSE